MTSDATARPEAEKQPDTRHPSLVRGFAIFCLSLAVYFVSTEHLIQTVHYPTGDEPYYLLIAHSLVHDHDFELTNNFGNGDYLHYYPGDLTPRHEAATAKPIIVSKHSLGLPLLIAPAYALADWPGAAHMMNLIGALLAVNLSLLAREAGAGRRGALAVWAALAFAAPFFTYAELIFPEAPAALLIVYAYRHLRGDGWARSNRAQRLLAALCLAYLPWLHARFLFVVAGLALYGWAQIRSGAPGAWRASAAVYVMPLLVSLGLLAAYDLYVYDSPLPNYADHSGSGAPPEIFAAFFGVWLDQQWGLLNHAPIYLLSLVPVAQAVGGWRVGRSAYAPELGQVQDLPLRRPSQRINAPRANALPWLALIALPYFALIVQYRYWWGEWCPPARYLTPILPLMVEPLVMAVARQTHARFRAIFALSSLLGWGVALAFALDGNLMYNHPLGQSRLLLALGGLWSVDLTRFEPSFIMMFLKEVDPAVWVVTQTALTLAWMAALGLAAWVAFGPWRRHTALKDS